MAKLTRVPAKVFAASAASDEIGQFGSAVAGSKLETSDVATIQALSAWLDGWSEALVSGNRYPALQEMNGLLKVLSYQGAYALQEGIPEYDSATTYYIGSVVKKTGTFELYGSISDDNVGNALVDGANWKNLGDLSALYQVPVGTIIYVSTTGNDTTGDGTSSSPYATLQKALDYLNGKTLLGAVTIQLAGGIYTSTSMITINHPQGRLITIQGNISDRTKVTLQFNGVNGISVYYGSGLQIQWLTINGNETVNTSGINCFAPLSATQVIVKNFGFAGFRVTKSTGHATLTNCLVTTNSIDGIFVGEGASSLLINTQSTSNARHGLMIYGNGYCDAVDNNSFTNNGSYGLNVDANSRVSMASSTTSVSGNTTGAIIAQGNSTCSAVGVTISGTLSPAANTSGNVNSYIYR